MKPLQIAMFVLVGALAGAVIMKLAQRPRMAPAAPVPAASVAPAPVAPPVPPLAEAKPMPPSRPTARPEAIAAQNQPPVQQPPAAPEATPTPQEPAAISGPPASAPPPVTAPAEPPPVADPASEPAEAPSPQQPPSVTLQRGQTFSVRLGENLSSDHNQAGDAFTATLDAPLSAGGFVIAEKGARAEGRVVEAVKGSLTLELTNLHLSDGQILPIRTEAFRKQVPRNTTDDVGLVAAAAGVGAIIGAMAGGGKGAAIGAGAGGAVGAGGVAASRQRSVSLPSETKVTFRLKDAVMVTERLNR